MTFVPLHKASIVKPVTAFGEVLTSSKSGIIELKSAVNAISQLRNVTTLAGSATVSVDNSEYRLSTTAAAGDAADFSSGERGRYLPGFSAETGIGLRLGSGVTFTGTSNLEWGYVNGTDGYGYGVDATGIYVFILRAGVKTKTYQSSWSHDKLDGTAGTAFNLNLEDGNIFNIEYTWYGYGAITFGVVKAVNNTDYPAQSFHPVHTIVIDGQTSIEQPNCPIKISIDNGDSAVARNVYVGGRRYAINGEYKPVLRITGDRNQGVAVTNSAWKPLISFRRKSGSKFLAQSVKINDLDVIADGNVFLTLFHDANLTTGTAPVWGTPTDATADETVLESDTTADTITGGIQVGGVHLISGSNQRAISQSIERLSYDLIEEQNLTLCARSVGASANITACTLTMTEEW